MTPDKEMHNEDHTGRGLSLERSEGELAEANDRLRVIHDDDGRVAAHEILQTISGLMSTLNTERKVVLMAEEHRRSAEVENARLQAELLKEQELRRRAEAELERLRDEIGRRQKRVEAELDRLWAEPRPDDEAHGGESAPEESEPMAVQDEVVGRLAEEEQRRARAEAELQRASMENEERRQRAMEELERRRAQGASEESLQRFKDGLERLLGEELDEPPPSQAQPRHDHAERSLESIWAPQTTSAAADAPHGEEEEPPPLPPGWRYASDLAQEDKGRRWGRRRRARH